MQQSLKSYGLRTVPKIVNTFNNIIVKGKDKQPTKTTTNVVYQINCENCNASSVGETKRQFNCHEHIQNIQKEGQYVNNQHINEYNHKFDFDNTKILDRGKNWRKRLVSEMTRVKMIA